MNWVLDADIRGFFDAISHEGMRKFLQHRIGIAAFLRLIEKWLQPNAFDAFGRNHLTFSLCCLSARCLPNTHLLSWTNCPAKRRLPASDMIRVRLKSLLSGSITLQASITMAFALLVLPALATVIGFSFYENVQNLTALSNRFIDRASDDAAEMSNNLLQPVAAALRLMAAAEGDHAGFLPV